MKQGESGSNPRGAVSYNFSAYSNSAAVRIQISRSDRLHLPAPRSLDVEGLLCTVSCLQRGRWTHRRDPAAKPDTAAGGKTFQRTY